MTRGLAFAMLFELLIFGTLGLVAAIIYKLVTG